VPEAVNRTPRVYVSCREWWRPYHHPPAFHNQEQTLKKLNITASLIAAAVAVFASSAYAEDAAAPKTRAEVKAETKKAVKDGTANPPGEGSGATQPTGKSEKARADVKAETKKAVKEGTANPKGEGSAATAVPAKSEKSRAEVKAETKKAAKEGKLTPAGEK
jgi:hypothetical protein